VTDDRSRRNPKDPDDYDSDDFERVALIRDDDTDSGAGRAARSVFADPEDDLIVEEDDEDDGGLPHWTDPPTGSTPAARPDDLDAWATITGSQPRWRNDAADFDDEPEVRYEEDEIDIEVVPDADDDHDFFGFEDDDDFGPDFDLGPAEPAVVPIESRRSARAATPDPAPAAAGAPGRGRPAKAQTTQNEMGLRIGVGVILAATAIAAFMAGPKFTIVLVAVVLGVAVAELFSATRRAGYKPAVLLGIAATVAMPLAVYWRGLDALPLLGFLTVAFALLWYLVGAETESPLLNVGVTTFGVFYVGFLGSFAALMLKGWGDDGIGILIGAVVATVSYDIGGLVVGRTAGRAPLSAASPNKTVEGLFGGMIVSVLVTTVVVGQIAPWGGAGDAFILGVAAAIAAPLGDLCESMLKRDLGVKDMGSILPGHGGLLDRFDALLFVLPVTYEIARLLDVA
jgi:phosphatidate cytidylyltransferase